jgi:hypothetical protein
MVMTAVTLALAAVTLLPLAAVAMTAAVAARLG